MPSSDVSAISTTFTPPATCTQSHLTLMEYYAYQIWLNYPVPVPGITSTDCYPSQYMSSFFSAQSITTPLPAPTPLVCPVGYGTILSTTVSSSSEYIACCPSSFLLARPTASTLSNRPAYGGTCYSDISTVVVTAYDNSSAVATSTWAASVSGAQAYALVIEGYASANATGGNGIFASSTSSSSLAAPTTTVFVVSSTSSPSATASPSKGLSGGAVAGIIIGCIVGVLLLAGAGLLFLRNRRQSHAAAAGRTSAGAEMEGDPLGDKGAKALPYASQPPTDSHTELPGGEAAHEVETPMSKPVEMQGEAGPHEMDGS